MYDNSTKDTWRGWAWNQVASRLPKTGNRSVMVLAGDIAGDHSHAERRGLECVAVDARPDCVKRYRKAGGVAVCDSLINQMLAISPGAVIADFTGGMTANSMAFIVDAMSVCDVVVFNLLRGRDAIRKEHSGKWAEYDAIEYTNGRPRKTSMGKHRGKITMSLAWVAMSGEQFVPDEYWRTAKPSFYSYKSKDSNQVFDSAAMSTSSFSVIIDGQATASPEQLRMLAPVASRRKAAAAKAVTTKRRAAMA